MLDFAEEEKPKQALDDMNTRGERAEAVRGAKLLLDEDDVPNHVDLLGNVPRDDEEEKFRPLCRSTSRCQRVGTPSGCKKGSCVTGMLNTT